MMPGTGFIYHESFLRHNTGTGHPENSGRLEAFVSNLKSTGLWNDLHHPVINPAPEKWILANHSPEHLESIREACSEHRTVLDDGETRICPESFDVARLAAGAALAGVDAVMHGDLRSVFCAVRPPGHHAERNRAMGFCLFNNIAVAARYAKTEYGLKRVAIIDWDVHHGNGTQHSFEDDPGVLYISLHQYPLYPGTGAAGEEGTGAGRGFTLNLPMPPGAGDEEYLHAFNSRIIPRIGEYRPELILISAGFDAHYADPLASINCTEDGFAEMSRMLVESAGRHCGGRIISILEGGYDTEALKKSVEVHLTALMG